MLDIMSKMFTRRDPRRDAQNCLARIISRFDMSKLSYNEGIVEDRRSRQERHLSIGVWLFPIVKSGTPCRFDIEKGVPAVTHDIRSEGLGVMTPVRLHEDRYVVAIPDEGSLWRFFEADVRHNTRKPGSWYMLGMHINSLVLPESDQMIEFREHVTEVCESAEESLIGRPS